MVEITEVETRPSSSSLHDEVVMSRESTAAVKLQKVYRSWRTRRKVADAAVLIEGFGLQAELSKSAVFSNFVRAEHGTYRLNRFAFAAQAANGSCKLSKDQKLAFQRCIEANDPRHRYGRRLYQYYSIWRFSPTFHPFFYWLDIGDGIDLDIRRCRRSKLQQHRIMYLGHSLSPHSDYYPPTEVSFDCLSNLVK
ncbi:hypothetical protein K2173_002115 [Erythroxylum novogranatense]|uniref:Uncharacterized protein n=1 Tax=Erythroxylum novogranatense TaxID=1862640 RepID=A0AAV8SQK6_9ROSI|nr:hypothetical protein K2173_002115 [Erythroxylum novogranatense]